MENKRSLSKRFDKERLEVAEIRIWTMKHGK